MFKTSLYRSTIHQYSIFLNFQYKDIKRGTNIWPFEKNIRAIALNSTNIIQYIKNRTLKSITAVNAKTYNVIREHHSYTHSQVKIH